MTPPRSLHLLYVEDDEDIAQMYGHSLGMAGHEVSLAADGEAGLESAFAGDPDLVLLDMRLPKMNGLTVLQQLRRRLYRGRVWVLSNYSDDSMRAEAEAQGAERWLVKADTTPGILRRLIDEFAAQAELDADPTLRDLSGRAIDDLDEAVLVTDDKGSYVAVSNRALELLGYQREELLGCYIWDIAADVEAPTVQEEFEAFKGHGAQTGDFALKTRTGALITINYEAYAQVRPGLHMSILKPRAAITG
ncbi:MAG: hypothetical protein NVSMB17_13670 [Candidatus Dormibacteria bacterium]